MRALRLPGKTRTVSISITVASQCILDVDELRAVCLLDVDLPASADVLDKGSARGERHGVTLLHDLRY